ncbi:MAG: bifunctional (p)ppGpp synthetase/guanosine-3',5'-bis(diphosphate) 3'-pyrophosphohydrolase [Ruminococcus sp.]|nr:bifunctional (p)ppGpp synthetase/guanosine-3',5'-bis(diphosphate) 3'-pyrophosphohydrolase [Ruminococcus sp.]
MVNNKIAPITTCDLKMFLNKLTESDKYNTSKIITAYKVAEQAHKNQFRKSGEPYIIHPLCVSMILLELGMDTDTICAGMLHDVVEDTDMTLDEICKQFGQDVAMLVDSVTKLGKIPYFSKEEQAAEDVRKIVIATAKDIRVIIIKLADRLHNMRTLQYRTVDGQLRTARETMNIFAPIAHRLGIYAIQNELEEISFKYLDQYAYQQIEGMLELDKKERENFIEVIKDEIRAEFKKYPDYKFLENATIDGRAKSIYSIYKKMFIQKKRFNQLYDKYAVRIIVDDQSQCYVVLGIIHNLFTPLPNRVKDYIANPKPNMYQSLHTTVVGKDGIAFEIQIRSWEMHRNAEYGIAAHWKYKERIKIEDTRFDNRVNWFRNIIEAQQSCDDVESIVDMIKDERMNDDILVMTPKGDPITMPNGCTIIDFAYKIHTEVGHKAMGARVNGSIVPLEYRISTGDIVEIITSKDPNKGPNRAWLNIATTTEAKTKIRTWFKKEKREENILQGKDMIDREFKRNKMNIPEEDMYNFLCDDFKRYNCETLDDYYASVGYGGIIISKIIQRLKNKYDKLYTPHNVEQINVKPSKKSKEINSHGIEFENGLDNCEIKISQCCSPMPYDEIVGFITRGKGVSIHKKTCPNYKAAIRKNADMNRWIEAHWRESKSEYFQVNMEVVAIDRIGLVYDITCIMTESRIMIKHSSSGTLKNKNAIFRASIYIANIEQLNNLFDKLKKVDGVISVNRV